MEITMSEQTGSVTPPVVSSASTETTTTLSKADNDFKRDMFKYKDELAIAQGKLNDIAMGEEQRKGNFEGVIGTLKQEIKSLKATSATDKFNYANTQLDSAIKSELVGRGVTGKKLDAFMKLVDDNDKSIVELDASFNPANDDVKSLVDKNMERYSDLFIKQVKIVDGVPSRTNVNDGAKKIDVNAMSWEQALAYAKTLKD
jgi:hypothetical protein